MIIYFVFLYQRKRFRHQREMLELRETLSQALLQSKLEIQEQTLDHIAKELHANFSHIISLININLAELLPQTPTEQRENVLETKSLAKQLLSELKALSASLNTDHIMHIGFTRALENELNRLEKARKCKVIVTRTGEEFRLKPEDEIILFRLCQEVLNNIVKYASATEVTARIIYAPDQLILQISDNGIGFDYELMESLRAEKESTGILNIEKRAALIHAEILISSKPGAGTSVKITIPKTGPWNQKEVVSI